MAYFDFFGGGKAKGDSVFGALFTRLLDSTGNNISKKHRQTVSTTQEALLIAGKNDDIATFLRTDRKGNLLIGNYAAELIEAFEGATVNVQKWTSTSTTFAPTQSTGNGYLFNPAASVAANAVSILQSQRLFYKFPRVPLQLKSRIRANIVTNSVMDLGFGIPTTTTLIVPNGVAVRCVNGLWSAVITSNSVELIAANITDYATGLVQLNTGNLNAEFYVVDIILDDDNLVVTIQNTQTGVIVGYAVLQVPLSALKMFAAAALPVYHRVYNSAVAPAQAPNLNIAEMQVLSLDMNVQMDASQVAGNLGLTAGRNPFTGAQLENHANSTAPVSATLSNTAAGYTTLGGRFQFAAVAGAVTDYALFAFTVPAGSKFLCEGIHIELYNTVVAVATTPTIFEWAIGFNSSALSLATANIIRRQIGCQNFQIGAGIGACATPLDMNFITPEVVESGRFVHIILNIPVGTATATEIFRGQISVKGRFI
jgi:hypothetical protein